MHEERHSVLRGGADPPALDPEDYLQDLQDLTRVGAGAAHPSSKQRYCSFCWTALEPGATECAECGKSLEEMVAARKASRQSDSNWVPPNRLLREAEGSVTVSTGMPTGIRSELGLDDPHARQQAIVVALALLVAVLAIVAFGGVALFSAGQP